ncbi:unnamed protein product [Schistosoma bovis]|nr:unnamed protein product [Schistosoma bovis]CAH8478783.1 unnamed protein product [Schistosoma bovis]
MKNGPGTNLRCQDESSLRCQSSERRGSRNDHLSAIIRYCKHFMLHLFPNYFHLKSCTVYSHYDKFYVIV